MLECQVEIVNSRYDDNKQCIVQFIPYCISTVKIKVTNKENQHMHVWIHPINSLNTDEYCGGYDDHQKGIKLIW